MCSDNFPRTYIIAEMACSHEGDPALAKKIIDGAGRAGADAIQFQIWSLKDMVVPQHPSYELLSRIELSQEAWAELARYVRKQYPGMEIIACIYETKSLAFAETIGVDAYKIHSADLSNPLLLDEVSRTGRRIDLSVGASTLVEIENAIVWIRAASPETPIWLMYGYQSFPTPTNGIHLRYMMKLKNLFELPIGYQDHSDANADGAFWLPAAAVGMGVDILEKHITHDRGFKGIDHESALNPDEFVKFVDMVREIEAAQGIAVPKPFSEAEAKYRKYSKKSLVAGKDLAAGSVVGKEDLLFMRAETLGLPPDQAERLVGRTLKKPVARYACLTEEDLQ
ncbi:N-acetylneuraminate synthase family protein [Thiovibrio sp. JS02]